jgi:glyoxalase/bleomycin resistance protein/dioxygenase superfamily protein
MHPAESEKPGHEIYLMCDDIDATAAKLEGKGVRIDRPFFDEPSGRLAFINCRAVASWGSTSRGTPSPNLRPAPGWRP